MQFKVMQVTPEIAASWLDNNGMNRKISKAHTSKLADVMNRGKWVLNGQSISFDENGRLLDGQHRLSAVVMSGKTVQMTIALGVSDPEAFKSYDGVALKRGAHQVAAMMGVNNSNRVAAIARIIIAWEESATTEEFSRNLRHGATSSAPDEVAEKACEIQDEAEAADSMANCSAVQRSGSRATVISMIVIFARIDPVSTASFCHKLKSGLFTSDKDPVFLLRDRLMSSDKTHSGKNWKVYMVALIIKAFNAHRKGKEMGVLRWRTEGSCPEGFPRINGAAKQ